MSAIRMTLRLCTLLTLVALASVPARAGERPVVVELFTSQGCASCPPADAFLHDLANRDGVIALSFNVDYWNYLGWTDTLASPAHTERQRAYVRRLGLSGVYTPQMVVNGAAEGVGSKRDKIEEKIAAARSEPFPVDIAFTDKGDTLVLDVGTGKAPGQPVTLWFIRFANEEKVEIGKGENRGRTMIYAHAVRELTPVGMWNGEAMKLTLPKNERLTAGLEGCVALLQAGTGGPILGAAQMAMN
ncbi:MAG: DUF1223 domain-containing protein [Parvibaculum sp.]|uniref:DUF1223 domain-containing protein n=1 Tax=Parvibaculum sp. TaxID=2024848 RepID=UPI002AB8F0F6|nr:DUF1223 domain-containing protein [Parvibaculum sp.]MDZ4381210.1 DUF1223 domain-containing protein [Parvibaculum sp.]